MKARDHKKNDLSEEELIKKINKFLRNVDFEENDLNKKIDRRLLEDEKFFKDLSSVTDLEALPPLPA